MGRKKRSPKMELFRSAFGASSVTSKNVDRGITSINRRAIHDKKHKRAEGRVIRQEVVRQTEEARKKGDTRTVKRGEKVMRETSSDKRPRKKTVYPKRKKK